MAVVSRETLAPHLPPEADIDQLQAYHDVLATDAVTQGLIGPREAARLWDRHIGNSAWVVLPAPGLVPTGARVADVGSGAGLPGVVWSIVRPDITMTLIEPLLRRAAFLERVVAELGLGSRVEVVRDRAENMAAGPGWDVVTARAVAPLDRLVGWTVPLLSRSGILVALKGESAEAEIVRAQRTLDRVKAGPARVATCGDAWTESPTRVIVVPRKA